MRHLCALFFICFSVFPQISFAKKNSVDRLTKARPKNRVQTNKKPSVRKNSLSQSRHRKLGAKTLRQVQDIFALPLPNRRELMQRQPEHYFRIMKSIFLSRNYNNDLRWKALMSMTRLQPEKSLPYILKALRKRSWFF